MTSGPLHCGERQENSRLPCGKTRAQQHVAILTSKLQFQFLQAWLYFQPEGETTFLWELSTPDCFISHKKEKFRWAIKWPSKENTILLFETSPPLCAHVQDPAAVWSSRRSLQGVQRPQSSPGRPDREVRRHRNFHRRGEGQPCQQRQHRTGFGSGSGSGLHPQTDREEGDEEEGDHYNLLNIQMSCFHPDVCFFSSLSYISAHLLRLVLSVLYPGILDRNTTI